MCSEYIQPDAHSQVCPQMIHRHSPFYLRAVCTGKFFKTSNRNDVLLGQEEHVKNTQTDH